MLWSRTGLGVGNFRFCPVLPSQRPETEQLHNFVRDLPKLEGALIVLIKT